MIEPDFEWINTLKGGFGPNGTPYQYFSQATGVHPNPRFFKYYFWVFWSGSPVDGPAFLETRYRLPFSATLELRAALESKGERYILYNRQLPRCDAANPFDLGAKTWGGREVALPYDEDPDPIARGQWAGHR